MFKHKIKIPLNSLENLDIKPRQRTDEVEVLWKWKDYNKSYKLISIWFSSKDL